MLITRMDSDSPGMPGRRRQEYYIGSADLMNRNLVSRVEVLAPIPGKGLQAELRELLDLQLNDTHGAWEMVSDGSYRKRTPTEGGKHSQLAMIESAVDQATGG